MAIVNSIGSAFLILVVRFYRKVLSPLKSTRCAHAVIHGKGHSCSDLAMQHLENLPLPIAIRAIQDQFLACAQAKIELEEVFSKSINDIQDGECCEVAVNVKTWFASLNMGEKIAWIYVDTWSSSTHWQECITLA